MPSRRSPTLIDMSAENIRVLSVRQPWASLIQSGRKTIELRCWSTRYRGQILICAASARSTTQDGRRVRLTEGDDTPVGVALCIADLIDVRPAVRIDAAAAGCAPCTGEFSFVLADVRPVDNFRVLGKLGLWRPSTEIIRRIDKFPQRHAA